MVDNVINLISCDSDKKTIGETIELIGHSSYAANYLKYEYSIGDNDEYLIYSIKTEFPISYSASTENIGIYVDVEGGPMICAGEHMIINDRDRKKVIYELKDITMEMGNGIRLKFKKKFL